MGENLLKLTTEDVIDAHSDTQGTLEYKEVIKRVEQERDSQGKLIRPWRFEVVQGFFKQSDPKTDDSQFNYIDCDFGLALDSWDDLKQKLKELNDSAKPNESYKLIFCARHGQGFHNRAVIKYGIDDWNKYWAKQTGDGETTWGPDPFLTPDVGEIQAEQNHDAWVIQIGKGCPIPTKYYSSPFTRSSITAAKTWNGISICEDDVDESTLVAKKRYFPVIKEDLRERMGVHICDMRSTKTVIESRVGKYGFKFEPGFEEEDKLFDYNVRETLSQQSLRSNSFLNYVFENDKQDSVISCTSHAGTIRSIITAVDHRLFAISTGGMIPIVIKGTRVE